jgi:hypothetical protein
MGFLRLLAIPLLAVSAAAQQPLTAADIMSRVAANQDRAVELRSHYVYKQHIHSLCRKTNGKLMREETRDYVVFPAATGSERKLRTLIGRYWHKGRYEEYNSEPVPDDSSLDAELVTNFTSDERSDRSRDGIAQRLFPLTSEQQKQYDFRLIAEETFQKRPAYHLAFEPKDKKELDWKGEAYIDREDFQPMYVFTKPSRKIPFFARSVLGVNLPGVGFTVQYSRQPDGVWFPESFGTEFELHLLHVYSRLFTVSLKNSEFQKTHADTVIHQPATE